MIILQPETRTISNGERTVKLQPQMFEIMEKLCKAKGTITVDRLHDWMYQLRPDCDRPKSGRRVVIARIHRLRKELRNLGLDIPVSHRGAGYVIKPLN